MTLTRAPEVIRNSLQTLHTFSKQLWIKYITSDEALNTETEFLDEIQTKILRVFLLAIHSHLYSFALRFQFLQTHASSYSFYSSDTEH